MYVNAQRTPGFGLGFFVPLEYGKRCKSVATVKACGEGAKQICSLLYKDAPVYLERKYQTYLQMMGTKDYRIFSARARANMSKAALKTWERRKSASNRA